MAEPVLAGLERNAVVAASAGTGKTHLITNIYIAHVLGLRSDGAVISPERIVATTFSRAAAREIRERLELRLSILCGEAEPTSGIGLDSALGELVAQRELSDDTLRERAAAALENLPRGLVDTLHGLSIKLLRQHAVEIGVPPGFAILDEHEAQEEARSVIEEVLADALARDENGALGVRALIEACQGLENTSTAVVQLLGLLDEEGLDASELALPEHARDAGELKEQLSAALQGVAATGASDPLSAPAFTALSALGGLPDTASELQEALIAVTKPDRRKLAKLESGRWVLHLLDHLLVPKKSREERVRTSIEFLSHAGRLEHEAACLRAVLSEVQLTLRARRSARGRFAFSDVLRLSRDALRDRPDLAARSASELELLLVDEFQDTSRVQRDLVLLLREDAAKARRRPPGELPRAERLAPRGLVVVGDRKQSIYAFRGADVAVFTRLAAELAGEPAIRALELRGVSAPAAPVADLQPLVRNYRSAPEILDFVNRVAHADFNPAPSRAFEIRFMPSEELVAPPASSRAAGKVSLVLDEGGTPEGADAMLAGAGDAMRQALLAAAYCARARRQGAAFRDLALLARRRATLPLLELALDRLAIPFVVSGRALYATQEVRDLAALLRLAVDPYDRFALAVVARSPLGGLSDASLAALAEPQRGLLPFARWREQALSEPEQQALVSELSERLREVCEVGPRLSPRDFLAFAAERFELEALLGGLPRGALRVGNVGRLLEIAARHGGSLPQFVRWLDRQIALDVDEHEAAVFSEDDDAVRLLTVHASKGLSFPITVLLDLTTQEQPRYAALGLYRRDDGVSELSLRHRNEQGAVQSVALGRAGEDASARAQAERQRLSYVALTRAERELALIVPLTSRPRENTLARTIEAQLGESWLAHNPAIERLAGSELLAEGAFAAAEVNAPSDVIARPERATWHSATVGVTALSDFSICPRRFQLLHVLGLQEPRMGSSRAEADAGDARALGSAAHRVLERVGLERWGEAVPNSEILLALEREGLDPEAESTRETASGIARFLTGSYARETRERAVRIHREIELTLVILRGSREIAAKRQLELFAPMQQEQQRGVLRATLDLVIERRDGSIDIVDYKRTRGGGAKRYALQLAAYRAAVAQNFGARTIRTGLFHLLGDSDEPEWVTATTVDLYALVDALASARFREEFSPVPKKRCQLAHCGFVLACHPGERETPAGHTRGRRKDAGSVS